MAIPFRLNQLDRAIAWLAPRAAYRRGVARAALDGTRGYDGAAVGRRTDGWNTTRTSADAEISRAMVRLRNRSRDLTRNNPHARKAVSVWTSNIVGTGIEPRPNSGNESLDARASELFQEWSAVADADGQLDFNGLQDLAVREMVEGGEVLIRRRLRRPEDGLPVPLQLQIMEGDQLDESKVGRPGGGNIINGVEFDAIGRRSAYWLYPAHPGNASFFATPNLMSVPVPASEIAHLYRKERTQVRGVPWASAVIQRLRDLDDYEDAEITRKKIEACVVAIVMGGSTDDPVGPTTRDGLAVKDASGNPIEQFEPGLIAYSDLGRDIKFNNPGQSGGYPDYKRVGLHSVAAGYLLPHMLLTGDLSEVNFTSSRVGLIDFRRLVEAVQWLCVIQMALNPVWRWFCEAAYLSGRLPVRDIPVTWDTPRFESVQPLDDTNADIALARAGLDSPLTLIARRTGRDPEEVLREIARFNALVDELNLVLDSDPRHTARSGVEQAVGSPAALAPPAQGRPNLRPVA